MGAPVAHRQPENNRGFEMAKVTINSKDYVLKYTIESWKKLKENHGITPNNFQDKLNEDFASVVSSIIFYGISPADRSSIKIEELDSQLGFDVVDVLFEAIMESMPNSSKKNTSEVDGSEKK